MLLGKGAVKFPTVNTSALDVANYLIERASRENKFLDPLMLQKLLYYAQCWSLAEHSEPLFDDDIQAWKWGPVVPVVWKAYSGRSPIVPREDLFYDPLSDEQARIVEAVWCAYRDVSGTALSRMTHKEHPWLKARGKSSEDRPSRAPLSRDLMRKAAKESLEAQNRWLSENLERVTRSRPEAA